MFYQYDIKKVNNEDILYLYLNMKYEFSNELSQKKDTDLARECSIFIKNNKIPFKGNKIYLVVDGIIVKAFNIKKIDTSNNNTDYSVDNFLINIKFDDDSLCEITLRNYLISLLLSKYLDYINDEVYKSIAVLYNTYAYRMMSEFGYIYSDNSFAIYKPITYYKASLNNYDDIINKFNSIINEVDCMYLSYNNQYILPFIHYSNNGKTLTNSIYPYLSSVNSLWDMTSPYYIDVIDYSFQDLRKKLSININSSSIITIYQLDGYKSLKINDMIFSLEEIKKLLNLKSNDIYIIINNNSLRFITRGWGNFYGLSLFGANEIARNGAKFNNILNYYFPNVRLCKHIKELL